MRWLVKTKVEIRKGSGRMMWKSACAEVEARDGNEAAKLGAAEVAKQFPGLKRIRVSGVTGGLGPPPPEKVIEDAPRLPLGRGLRPRAA